MYIINRLNVVEKPVERSDVYKPRTLPDGKLFYECCYCHKGFGSVSDINRHMDFHEGIVNVINVLKNSEVVIVSAEFFFFFFF